MDQEELEHEIESQYVPEDEYSQIERALQHQHHRHKTVRPHIVQHTVPEKPSEHDDSDSEESSEADSNDELKEMDELIHPSYLVQKEEKKEKKEDKKEKSSPKETPKSSSDS